MTSRRPGRRGHCPEGLLALILVCSSPALLGSTAFAADDPWFEEISRRVGITFTTRSGHDEVRYFPEIQLGGAALLDFDRDGDLDIYLIQGGSVSRPGTETSRNRLFRNDGGVTASSGSGLRFTDVTANSGAGDSGYGIGVASGDYDNDGDPDLYVTNLGANALLRNDGDGTFTDVTERSGTGEVRWSSSAAFFDADADGDLDLFVTNYLNWNAGNEIDCFNPYGGGDYCNPTNYNTPATDVFYRNEGDGTFTDVSVGAGLGTAFGNGLGVVTGDFDANGAIDVFVANDLMVDQLWLGDGRGRFREEALLWGVALDENGKAKAGMGVVTGDPDTDGDLDILVVNLIGESDSFYRNEGQYFSDHTVIAGLGTKSRLFTRFGVGLADFDNDGLLDLYEANGGVTRSAEPLTDDPYAQPNLLFRGLPGGRFEELMPRGGTAEPLIFTSRAAAFGDIDNDGGVDVLIANRDGPAHLLRNVVPNRGHWLQLRVVEEHGRDALGATVTLELDGRTLRRDVQTAYSYCAANDPRVHFGLGESKKATNVTVRWVDGKLESFGDLQANRIVVLEKGHGKRLKVPTASDEQSR